jgi:ADP-heptose:LPS heptosyltransferase
MVRYPLLKLINKIVFYLVFIFPSMGIVFCKRLIRFKQRDVCFPQQIRNIAVFQLGHLGDFIHTIPLLRNLKLNFQSVTITMIGGEWNRELAKDVSYIDHYIVFNNWLWDRMEHRSFIRFLLNFVFIVDSINKKKFDIGIELKGHINSIYLLYASNIRRTVGFNYKNHGVLLDYRIPIDNFLYEKDRLLSILPAFGAKIVNNHFEFIISQEKEKRAADFLLKNSINSEKPLISIFPGASYAPKRWPAEKYASLVEKIIENNIGNPLLIGGVFDKNTIALVKDFTRRSVLDWIGNDVHLMAALINRSKVFIGNDTGPLHIAVALNIPSISFFSSGNINRWGPKPPHVVLRADVPCSPCDLESDECKCPQVHCIDYISVETAFCALKSKLI